jgi:hypothetical protein
MCPLMCVVWGVQRDNDVRGACGRVGQHKSGIAALSKQLDAAEKELSQVRAIELPSTFDLNQVRL